MQELILKIESAIIDFSAENEKAYPADKEKKGNRAAAQRARKVSNELTKLLKEFQALSLEEEKA